MSKPTKWQLKIMASAGEMTNEQMFNKILRLHKYRTLGEITEGADWELDFLVKTFREQVLKVKSV